MYLIDVQITVFLLGHYYTASGVGMSRKPYQARLFAARQAWNRLEQQGCPCGMIVSWHMRIKRGAKTIRVTHEHYA